MTSGKQARKRRHEDGEEQPVMRAPARRVLPPSVAKEVRHERRRGFRRGLAYWSGLTPAQRKEVQATAEAEAQKIDEENPHD